MSQSRSYQNTNNSGSSYSRLLRVPLGSLKALAPSATDLLGTKVQVRASCVVLPGTLLNECLHTGSSLCVKGVRASEGMKASECAFITVLCTRVCVCACVCARTSMPSLQSYWYFIPWHGGYLDLRNDTRRSLEAIYLPEVTQVRFRTYVT